MSGPVDVLAVMREFATRKDPFGSTEEAARQYEVARAAVAELIEAGTSAAEAMRLSGMRLPRLESALARVKGGEL